VPAPRLFRVILPVADVDLAADFYGRLLGVPGQRVWESRHYFDCGGTILACLDPRREGWDRDAVPNPELIYFAVKDVDLVHARAREAGCRRLDEVVATRTWGERSFYAEDPFGNPICFVDEATAFTGDPIA
jgi:predicted enzyme related to lactoylglutathione lyase